MSLLVLVGLRNSGGKFLGLLNLSLQYRDPVISVCKCGGLESVLVSTKVEREIDGAIFGNVGNFGLYHHALVDVLSILFTFGHL